MGVERQVQLSGQLTVNTQVTATEKEGQEVAEEKASKRPRELHSTAHTAKYSSEVRGKRLSLGTGKLWK